MSRGVYCIKNCVDGKVYIGSTIDFSAREHSHFSHLRCGWHRNARLQHAFNKYGESSFKFHVLEECTSCVLYVREQYWIDRFDATDKTKGYNSKTPRNKGKLRSVVTKEKISASLRGRKRPENANQKTSKSLKQFYRDNPHPFHTKETCRKISETLKGYKHAPAARQNMALLRIGKVLSKKTRRKISKALKGKTHTTEHCLHMSKALKGRSAWNKGKPRSEKTKRKISESVKHTLQAKKKAA